MLIVGLGNPGPKYAKNRHNIGFMALDAMAQAHRFSPWRTKFQGLVAESAIETAAGPRRAILLKPQTYMNDSGLAAQAAATFYKIAPADIVAFYDEIDLAPGKFRLKTGGGAAGHNGVRSLIAHLGPEFRRARMGVGHPGDKNLVHHYVLSDFYKVEEPWVERLCRACADALPLLLEGREGAFQTRVTFLAPAPKDDGEDEPGPAAQG